MLIDWGDPAQAAAPAASARAVVSHTLEWLQGPGVSPGSLFARRSLLTRGFAGLAAVMELHAADVDAVCRWCSVGSGSPVPWPCQTWVQAATAVHGLPRLAVHR